MSDDVYPAGTVELSPTKAALRAGVTPEELMEAIWVAAEMRAGAAFAHATIALSEITRP